MPAKQRSLCLKDKFKSGSAFLLGPRQVGKTTLVKDEFHEAIKINLLKNDEYLSLSLDPTRLRSLVQQDTLTIVDEIQRLPELLNEVHYLIEEYKARFLMTGSSTRNLRKKGVNHLGGRAKTFKLHPFSAYELKDDFSLERAINYGLLPSVYFSDSPEEYLQAYAHDYIQQEILAEAAVRNILGFRRFLSIASHYSGKQVNYTKLSSDSQVKPTTLREHFEILLDSMIATKIECWKKEKKRKVSSKDKFYFFDSGIARVLQERGMYPQNSEEYGSAFESLIYHELRCFSDYVSQKKINYWRSESNLEVDFIVDENVAIEAKSSRNITDRDLKSLRAIKEEGEFKARILVCNEPQRRRTDDGIQILPFRDFIKELWNNNFSFQ